MAEALPGLVGVVVAIEVVAVAAWAAGVPTDVIIRSGSAQMLAAVPASVARRWRPVPPRNGMAPKRDYRPGVTRALPLPSVAY
jgi:hypothetical protein